MGKSRKSKYKGHEVKFKEFVRRPRGWSCVSKGQNNRREKVRKITQNHIKLGLVRQSKDFVFSSDGMGGHWSVLSSGITQLDVF